MYWKCFQCVSQDIHKVYLCQHLHSTWPEYLRRSGWPSIWPLQSKWDIFVQWQYMFYLGFFSFYFSIEIHTWLREAFNFFTFIFIFWNLTAFFWEIMEAIRFVLPNLKLRSDILIVGPIHLWFLCDPAATSIDLQWWSEVRARVIWKKKSNATNSD